MPTADAQAVKEISAAYERMSEQIGKVIVGQHRVIEEMIIALLSRGHCLLVGVPGLAKTLLVQQPWRGDADAELQAHPVHART